MKIFYRDSHGHADASAEALVEVSLGTAFAVFRALDAKKGFMGIVLDERYCLQLYPRKGGEADVEILDTSIPSFDRCRADPAFAEELIRAAFENRDVHRLARSAHHSWEHVNLDVPRGLTVLVEVPVQSAPTPIPGSPVQITLLSIDNGQRKAHFRLTHEEQGTTVEEWVGLQDSLHSGQWFGSGSLRLTETWDGKVLLQRFGGW